MKNACELPHVHANKTCIYCGLGQPFSDEHVFPAGMGGNDGRFLLKDMVCKDCNTGAFSKLETKLMRASPVAMARLFLQRTGRGKGKKASIPSIHTNSTTVHLEPHGTVEAEMTAGGRLITLLQLLFLEGDVVALTGGDHISIDVFLDALRTTLRNRVQVVEKIKDVVPARFFVETFEWDGAQYESKARNASLALPANRMWREPLKTPPGEEIISRAPTLFQRTDGQLCLRVAATMDLGQILSKARKSLPGFDRQQDVPYSDFANPAVHVSMSMDMSECARAMAKIGVNLVAFAYGEDYVRHRAFSAIKSAILRGQPAVFIHNVPEKVMVAFSGVPQNFHAAMLYFQQRKVGEFHAVMFIRLYGGMTQVVLLSETAPLPPGDQAILVVDYENHRIERFSDLASFGTKYPPSIT